MKSRTAGVGRIFRAMRYSCQGFRLAWVHEAAFRQEVCLFALLVPLTIALSLPALHTVLLLSLMGGVLVIELLNSALEAVVDKVSPDFDPLAGRAKDCASAAVFIMMIICLGSWLALAGPTFWQLLLTFV